MLPRWLYYALKLWPYLLAVITLTAAGWALHGYGQHEYRRGQAQVQARWDADRAEHELVQQRQQQEQAERSHAASVKYQEELRHAREQTRTIREIVTRTVPAAGCLDADSVQHVNAAIRGSASSFASR